MKIQNLMKMMTKKFFFFLIFSLLFTNLFSQTNVDSIVDNNAYKPGEKLVYSVSYGLIKGGEASMTVDVIQSGEDFYYYLRAKATTTGLTSDFATINDIYESWVKITTGYPVKAARNITENKYTLYDELLFYRNQGFVYSINSGKHKIPINCHDLLSAFYYARRMLFDSHHAKDEIIDLTTFFDNQLYPVKIKYLKNEKIKTKFGKINAMRFVPILEKDNPFKKEDDMQIWISDDKNYIPLKIKMKTKFGSVSANLIYYENLNNPL